MKKGNPIVILLITALVFLLGGCAEQQTAQTPSPVGNQEAALRNPPIQQYPAPAPKTEGSLFTDDGHVDFFTDVKANRIGDIVTINIVESSNASKQAQTDLSRDSSLGAGVGALLGYESHLGLPNEFNPETALDAKYKSKFKGSGKTTRKETMTAQISARIIQVLPNGDLVIRGSREIKLNNERQFIIVQGVVRSQDISPDNTVLSTHIADARIDYIGRGDISQQQRKGWLTRLADFVWPF